MIEISRIWMVLEPMDMRAGIDRLSSWIQESLGRSLCDGTAYAFWNRRGNRLKLLVWDGNGVWLCHRRLHRGQFVWPREGEVVHVLIKEQWTWLIAGVDWTRMGAQPHVASLQTSNFSFYYAQPRIYAWFDHSWLRGSLINGLSCTFGSPLTRHNYWWFNIELIPST